MKIEIPCLHDMIQETEGNLTIPELRVWIHPGDGDDYFEVFDTFNEALDFIKGYSGKGYVEPVPLVAFRGYEINLFEIEPSTHKPK